VEEAESIELVVHRHEAARELPHGVEIPLGDRPDDEVAHDAESSAIPGDAMPELPDIQVYVEHLTARTVGHVLERVRLASPFLLRTADPPIAAASGKTILGVSRLGKRLVFDLDGDLRMVVHLMVAGRFRWKPPAAPVPGKVGLAAFDIAPTKKAEGGGTLILTEASSKKRASLHLVRGQAGLDLLDPGGLEVMDATPAAFGARLRSENHTLKRALTDPHLFSGIGNAYSDEILHHARMSPVKLTSRLEDDEIATLLASVKEVLTTWTERLRARAGDFPENVTAFQPDMAVHGKFGKPCPRCGKPVQRIRYADNEMNYCPTCQTDGKLLADRSLSRLMRGDWPKTLDELEAKKKVLTAPSATPAPAPAPAKTKAVRARSPKPRS
jgi:formamidopyrimidine-DNA glycosylase